MKAMLSCSILALGLTQTAYAGSGWECVNTSTGLTVVVKPAFFKGGYWPGSITSSKSHGYVTEGFVTGVDFNAPSTQDNKLVFTSLHGPFSLSISQSPLSGTTDKYHGHASGSIESVYDGGDMELICSLKDQDTL